MNTPITLGLARAHALYRLAILTEDRTDDEQEALMALAAFLDGRAPRRNGVEHRVAEVERTRDMGK